MKVYKEPFVTCVDCHLVMQRTAPNLKRCPPCRAENTKWHKANHRSNHRLEENARQREKYAANITQERARRKELRDADPERHNQYHRKWRLANKDKLSWQRRQREYGTDFAAIEAIVASQDGLCPVCHEPLTANFHVDHDHATGKVRGILHRNCNNGIGFLGDDAARCLSAAIYLGYDPSSHAGGVLSA